MTNKRFTQLLAGQKIPFFFSFPNLTGPGQRTSKPQIKLWTNPTNSIFPGRRLWPAWFLEFNHQLRPLFVSSWAVKEEKLMHELGMVLNHRTSAWVLWAVADMQKHHFKGRKNNVLGHLKRTDTLDHNQTWQGKLYHCGRVNSMPMMTTKPYDITCRWKI